MLSYLNFFLIKKNLYYHAHNATIQHTYGCLNNNIYPWNINTKLSVFVITSIFYFLFSVPSYYLVKTI